MMEFFILMYLAIGVFHLNASYLVGSPHQSIWDAILWPILLFMYCLDNLITYLENK